MLPLELTFLPVVHIVVQVDKLLPGGADMQQDSNIVVAVLWRTNKDCVRNIAGTLKDSGNIAATEHGLCMKYRRIGIEVPIQVLLLAVTKELVTRALV